MPPSRSPATASTWRGVRSRSTARCGGSSSRPRHLPAGDDLAAERAEVGGQRIGDALRPAAGDRPADGVGAGQQREGEGAGDRLLEAQEGVGTHARQDSACAAGARKRRAEPGDRLQRIEPEAAERERVAQRPADPQRSQQLARDQVPVTRRWVRSAAGSARRPRPGRRRWRPGRGARAPRCRHRAGGRSRPAARSTPGRAPPGAIAEDGEERPSG